MTKSNGSVGCALTTVLMNQLLCGSHTTWLVMQWVLFFCLECCKTSMTQVITSRRLQSRHFGRRYSYSCSSLWLLCTLFLVCLFGQQTKIWSSLRTQSLRASNVTQSANHSRLTCWRKLLNRTTSAQSTMLCYQWQALRLKSTWRRTETPQIAKTWICLFRFQCEQSRRPATNSSSTTTFQGLTLRCHFQRTSLNQQS